MSNFRKFISVSAIAMLGVTNLLTPLSYANAADVENYDTATNPISTAQSFSFLMPAHHVYLYATTEANHYFVDYHGGSGAVGSMATGEFIYDTTGHLAPNEFVKTGYTWSSWNTGADGQGTTYASGAKVFNWTTVESGTEHVYAQWSANRYSIDYALNDSGTSQAVHPQTPTGAAFDELIEIVNPTRTGYSFSGWDIENMGTDSSHTVGGQEGYEGDIATGVTGTGYKNLRATEGTVHFAARWTAKDVEYTVNHFKQTLTGSYDVEPQVVTGVATPDQPYTGETTTYEGFTTPNEVSQIIDANGTTVFNYQYPRISYDLTLIAGRGIVSVSVDTDYSASGTNEGSRDYSIKYGDTVTLSYDLEDGYELANWSGGEAPSFIMPATGQVREAYAVPTTYKITVDTNGGTGTYPTGYNKETPKIDFEDPTGTKSTFLGWIGTDIVGTTGDVIIPAGSTGDRTYTAQWRCDTGYHASNSASSGDVNYGNCIANTETPFTIEYYEQTLTGGYVLTNTGSSYGETDKETGVDPDDREGFTTKTVEQKNINGDGSTVVEVRYDRNSYNKTIVDGTGLNTTASGANDANADGAGKHQYGDTVTLSYTEKPGYTFDHWTVEGSGFDPITLDSGNNTFTMPASDVTIKSYSTTNTYNLTIDKNGGTGGSDDRTYTVEDTVTLNQPSRGNSIFVGWSGTNITGEPDPTVSFSNRAYDSSYEAVWSCKTGYTENPNGQSCDANPYTVTIDYDDGEHANETRDFVYNVTGTIGNPSKTGYDFAGWTVSGASDTATVDGQPIESPTSGTEFKNLTTTSGGNVTLTANWTPKDDTEYTVYYYTAELSGGYTLAGTKTGTYTSDQDIAVSGLADAITGYVTPTEGYTAGGTSGPSGSGQTAITIDRHGTTEIYLFYNRGTFHVYLSGDAHVLSLSGVGDYRFGDTVNVSATVQSGYHFVRWDKRNDDWSPLSGSEPEETPEP